MSVDRTAEGDPPNLLSGKEVVATHPVGERGRSDSGFHASGPPGSALGPVMKIPRALGAGRAWAKSTRARDIRLRGRRRAEILPDASRDPDSLAAIFRREATLARLAQSPEHRRASKVSKTRSGGSFCLVLGNDRGKGRPCGRNQDGAGSRSTRRSPSRPAGSPPRSKPLTERGIVLVDLGSRPNVAFTGRTGPVVKGARTSGLAKGSGW